MSNSTMKTLAIVFLVIYIGVTTYTGRTNDTQVSAIAHPVEDCEELIATYEELAISYKKKDALQEERAETYQEIVDLLKGELGIK